MQPCSLEVFERFYYERAPLHVARNSSGYYREFFSLSELERVLFGTELTSNAIRFNKDGTPARLESYADAGQILDRDRMGGLFAKGCSVIVDVIEPHAPTVARLCRALETFFRHTVSANMYLTPRNSQGFAAHYDTHDAVILQIEGAKHWRLYGAPVELPLKAHKFDAQKHPAGPVVREVELKPGDLLYLPRGVMHDAKASDTFSLHLTVGLYPPLWITVFREALEAAGESELFLRRAVRPGAPFDESALEDTIQRVFSPASLQGAARRIERRFVSERRNGLEGQLEQIQLLEGLSLDSSVALRENVLYDVSEGPDGATLAFSGKTVALPAGSAELIRSLESGSPLRLGSLLPQRADALEVMRKLIGEGFAVVVADDARETRTPVRGKGFFRTVDSARAVEGL